MIKDLLAKVTSANDSQKTATQKGNGSQEAEETKGLFGMMLKSMQGGTEEEAQILQDAEMSDSSEGEEQTEEGSDTKSVLIGSELSHTTIHRFVSKEESAESTVTEETTKAETQPLEGQTVEVQGEEVTLAADQETKISSSAEETQEVQSQTLNSTFTQSGDEGQVTESQTIKVSDETTGFTNPETTEISSDTKVPVVESEEVEAEADADVTAEKAAAPVLQDIKQSAPKAETAQKAQLKQSPEIQQKVAQEEAPKQDVKTEKAEITEQVAKSVDTKIKTGEQTQEVNTQAQEVAAEEESKVTKENEGSEEREPINNERLETITRRSGMRLVNGAADKFGYQTPRQGLEQESETEFTADQEAILKELKTDHTESQEFAEIDRQAISSARLGDFTIQNLNLRRNVLPGLTQAFSKAASESKGSPESWQKHSFDLGDGNKIQLSTREIDGVVHLKLASSNPELMKILQEYGNEIKEHLEKECNISIDLQFDNQQGDNAANFFGDSSSQGGQQRHSFMNQKGALKQSPVQQKNIQQTVRRFGYNQMEWTA
jgi:hypothetical protein